MYVSVHVYIYIYSYMSIHIHTCMHTYNVYTYMAI